MSYIISPIVGDGLRAITTHSYWHLKYTAASKTLPRLRHYYKTTLPMSASKINYFESNSNCRTRKIAVVASAPRARFKITVDDHSVGQIRLRYVIRATGYERIRCCMYHIVVTSTLGRSGRLLLYILLLSVCVLYSTCIVAHTLNVVRFSMYRRRSPRQMVWGTITDECFVENNRFTICPVHIGQFTCMIYV